VNGEIDSVSHVFAFDLNGNLQWKSSNDKEFTGNGRSNSFPGSRSAPTVVDNLIYVCSGNGRLACFDKQTGKEKWAIHLVNDLKGILPNFGYSESVLVDKQMVFCFPGGSTNNAVALDRFSGDVIWTSKALSDSISYCSPMLIELPTRKILVNFSNNYLMGLDAQTGELLWSQKQENVKYKQQCNTPIFDKGFLYCVNGDGNGVVKLEISADGGTIKEVWRNKNTSNNFQGFLKIDDNIISTDRSQKMKIYNSATGEITDSLKITRGALIAADNQLYCYSDNGDVNLLKIEESKLELVSSFKCNKGTKEHFAHPVIQNGVLYIRHGKALMAYKIK
jgi:outer membrane protein assembly factor BamB